ncbi:MAG: hypothetical protein ACOCQD_04655 [archaeon]
MKTMKKIGTILVIGLMSMAGLVGCTTQETTYTEEQVDQMIKNATENVDITKDNDEAVSKALKELKEQGKIVNGSEYTELKDEYNETNEEVKRIKQILEEYKEEEEKRQAELEKRENSEKIDYLMERVDFNDKTFDSNDIKHLINGEIEHDGNDYDVEESITLTDNVYLESSLLGDEEFKENPYLIFSDKESVKYDYTFEEVVPSDKISREEPLTFNLLGEEVKVTDVSDGEVEVLKGTEKWLDVGESTTIDGKEVKVIYTDTKGESVGIEVDGKLDWVDEGSSKEINGIDIAANKVIPLDEGEGMVRLVMSDDKAYETIEDGDSVADESKHDSEWLYTVTTNDTGLESMGVIHNQVVDELDDDFKPLGLGDELNLPNEYATLSFEETNVDNYQDVEITFDEVDTGDEEYEAIVFKSEDKMFEVDNEKVDEVRVYWDEGYTVTYEDDDEIVKTDSFTIVNDDIEYKVIVDHDTIMVGDHLNVKIGWPEGKYVLGNTEGEEEKDEVTLYGEKIGERENNVLGHDGMIVYTPEENGEDNKVEFSVPNEKLESTFLLG